MVEMYAASKVEADTESNVRQLKIMILKVTNWRDFAFRDLNAAVKAGGIAGAFGANVL